MPSFRDTLELVLHADAQGAIGELKRFSSETEKQVQASESSLKRMSSGALKLGTAGMGAGGLLTALGDQERQASEGLKASIQAAGQSYDEYDKKIEAAVSHQEQFGHTAQETDNALSTLVGSFGDTSKALDQMQLVADLAAKKHISLADAAMLVAKAHGGAGRIFKEFNVQVEKNADGTKNYDGALGQLSDKLHGQASASVAGFTGWLKGMGAQAEDTVATLGEKFGPAILGVSTGLTALGGIGQGASAVMSRLRGSEEEAAGGASSLGSKLGTAGVAAGAALAVGALYEYGKSLNDTTFSTEELRQATQKTGPELAAGVAQLEQLAKGGGAFGGMLDDTLKKLVDMGPAGVGTIARIRDEVAAAGGDTSKYDAALDGAKQSQENLNTATEIGNAILGTTQPTVETLAETYKRLREVIKGTADEQKHYADVLKGETDPMFAIINAADAQAKSQQNVMEKTAALTQAIKDHGARSAEAAKAQDELNQANIDAVQKASDLTQAQLDLEAAVKKGTTSVDNARLVLQSWVDEGLITQGQADQMITRFDTLKQGVDGLKDSHINIALDFDAQQAEATLKYLLAETGNYAAQARENGTYGGSISGPTPPSVTQTNFGPADPNPVYSGSPGGTSGTHMNESGGISITNHFTTTDPQQTAQAIAQVVRAGQFLRG